MPACAESAVLNIRQ